MRSETPTQSEVIPAALSPQAKAKEAQRVTLVGAVLDGLLGIAKIIIGLLAHSQALVADGIHSLSDLATDFMVVAVMHASSQEPDKSHPYGHERFETLGTVVLGAVLVAVAGAMGYESLNTLLRGESTATPGWPALLVAALSIVSKEWIFRYTLKVGQRLKSDLLIANAWHSRTDAYSSLVVLIGIGGAMLGFPWLDSVAAIAVAVFVAKIGISLTWDSVRELVDTAIPADELAAITKTALAVEGVQSVHSFRSRLMGSKKLLEMHLQVAPHVSTSEGHFIGDCVVARLLSEHEDIGHVIFHVDTELDSEDAFCPLLPGRAEVRSLLVEQLERLAPGETLHQLTLHYLHNQIEIELLLEGDSDHCLHRLETQLNEILGTHDWFRHLQVWHRPSPPQHA